MSPLLARLVRRSTIASLVAMLACGAPPRPPVLPPTPGPAAPAVVDSLAGPWIPGTRSGSVQQEVRLTAALRSRVDSVDRLDTLQAIVGLEWARVAGSSARVSGLLRDFRVSSDTAAPRVPNGLRLPVPFSALEGADGGQASVERPDPAGCGPEAAAVQALREVMLTLPRRLEIGSTWSDSARYAVCRDSIPLSVTSERTFRVAGAERIAGAVVLLIDRTSRVTMRGTGTQFGELLTIEATGTGAMRLAVRLEGAVVVQGRGESTLEMTMRGRRRTQTLAQHTHVEIAAP